MKKLFILAMLSVSVLGLSGARADDHPCGAPVDADCTHYFEGGQYKTCEVWLDAGSPVDDCYNP